MSDVYAWKRGYTLDTSGHKVLSDKVGTSLSACLLKENGSACWARTSDPLINSLALNLYGTERVGMLTGIRSRTNVNTHVPI
jgi:hypothetical protein